MDTPWLETLDLESCLEHLRMEQVGRIAIIVDGSPIVLPITFRLLEASGLTWIALRTRPGNVIDQASMNVAFEIDGIDPARRGGWSVLVRGSLQHVDPEAASFRERFDPEPWLTTDRGLWLIIEPYAVTGRELHPSEQDWAFHPTAYL
jgi:nitroimidazol reductase NimA-like FMN-containing flavoprotein (pyridoxamine 5'-phosphate oxidase superfamily)